MAKTGLSNGLPASRCGDAGMSFRCVVSAWRSVRGIECRGLSALAAGGPPFSTATRKHEAGESRDGRETTLDEREVRGRGNASSLSFGISRNTRKNAKRAISTI